MHVVCLGDCRQPTTTVRLRARCTSRTEASRLCQAGNQALSDCHAAAVCGMSLTSKLRRVSQHEDAASLQVGKRGAALFGPRRSATTCGGRALRIDGSNGLGRAVRELAPESLRAVLPCRDHRDDWAGVVVATADCRGHPHEASKAVSSTRYRGCAAASRADFNTRPQLW